MKNLYKPLFSHPLFLLGMVVKLALGASLASGYLTDLFIPFVDYFVQTGNNPYQHFVAENLRNSFPYPALMLYILSIPNLPFTPFLSENIIFAKLLVYRLPLIICDIIILITLYKWLKCSAQRLLILYWLSPIMLYICYVHGQLDLIPVTLLIVSIYNLFRGNRLLSFALLGFALATKSTVLLTVPFFFYYLFAKNYSVRQKTLAVLAFLGCYILPNLPFLQDEAFYQMVFLNSEQVKLFDLKYVFSQELLFYFIPSIYLLLFAFSTKFLTLNRSIFILFIGFALGIAILFIVPRPGWYAWVIPFFTYFFAKASRRDTLVYFALQLVYLAYFAIVPDSDYFSVFATLDESFAALPNLYNLIQSAGYNANFVYSLSFTILQTFLLLNCLIIYKYGISTYSRYSLLSRPFVIGLCGNSGAGKSTLTEGVAQIFSDDSISIIRGDDMHKWERGHEKWQNFTHLDPMANHLHQEFTYLSKLKSGKNVKRRHYNHDTGKFTEGDSVSSNRLIIFEGLHPFYIKKTREIIDLKIFLDPDHELEVHRKILRDTKKRGYSKEKVMEQIALRKADYKKYIEVQKQYADLIIQEIPIKKIKKIGDSEEKLKTKYRFIIDNAIDVEPFLQFLSNFAKLKINYYYDSNDQQVLEIEGNISKLEILSSDHNLFEGLDDIGFYNPIFSDKINRILQLFVAYVILEKAKYNNQ